MILVRVSTAYKELCQIRIEPQEFNDTTIRYTAEFVVEREGAIGIHSRVFEVPAGGNVLALLKLAIESLDSEALELEEGNVVTIDDTSRDDTSTGYTCPHCKAISYNPHDKIEKYCGKCHKFEDEHVTEVKSNG